MENDPLLNRLRFRDMRILVAIAEAGSMAKAAERLSISQPAISRTITDLERALGVPLLERSPEGTRPTQYGEALIKRGVIVRDELGQGLNEIRFFKDPAAGELRIGSTMGLTEGLLLSTVELLKRRSPKLTLHIESAGLLKQIEMLRERRIDVGIAGTTTSVPAEEIHSETLFREPLVVVAGQRSPWARRRKIDLAELSNEQWVWSKTDTIIHSLVTAAFRKHALDAPQATIHAESTDIRLGLATTGRYLAVVTESSIAMSSRKLPVKILPVALPGTEREISVLTLENRLLAPQAQFFIACAHEVAKRKLRNGKWRTRATPSKAG